MNKEDFVELFEMIALGDVARYFYQAQITPTPDEWAILRREKPATLRDISNMAVRTHCRADFRDMETK